MCVLPGCLVAQTSGLTWLRTSVGSFWGTTKEVSAAACKPQACSGGTAICTCLFWKVTWTCYLGRRSPPSSGRGHSGIYRKRVWGMTCQRHNPVAAENILGCPDTLITSIEFLLSLDNLGLKLSSLYQVSIRKSISFLLPHFYGYPGLLGGDINHWL